MNNLQVTMKIATATEFKFKRLLEVWAKDFERMEAAIYQQQAAADNISALETLRLHDAMDAATSTAEASIVAIQQFMDQIKR